VNPESFDDNAIWHPNSAFASSQRFRIDSVVEAYISDMFVSRPPKEMTVNGKDTVV
jgi:hypothetical protein